jgi:alkylated DNA repair protein alkB family protein 6
MAADRAIPPCVVEGAPTDDLIYVPEALSADEEARYLGALYGPEMRPQQRKASNGLPTRCGSWQALRHRRLVMFGGDPDPKGTFAVPIPPWAMHPLQDALERAVGPCFDASATLEEKGAEGCAEATGAVQAFGPCPRPNHVLVNEYMKPHGIMPHQDGPLYHSVVSIFSLESSVAITFVPKLRIAAATTGDESKDGETTPPPAKMVHVVLEPRSLFIFKGAFYSEHLHYIADTDADVIDASLCANAHLLRSTAPADQKGMLTVPRGERRVSVTIRHVPNIRGAMR